MFFEDLTSIPSIAEKVGFSIFIIPASVIDALNTHKKLVKTALKFPVPQFPKTTFFLEPEKDAIKVGQIRTLESEMQNKEISSRFFVVKHAETMNEAAENAALKLLEEPKRNCHLVFLTTDETAFLETVLSRATLYVFKIKNPLDQIDIDEEILNEARALLKSSKKATFEIINRWTDKKAKKSRPEILKILDTAVEISYKSYFKTKNPVFLKKLPSLMQAYDNIKANGHIKLQLVANLC